MNVCDHIGEGRKLAGRMIGVMLLILLLTVLAAAASAQTTDRTPDPVSNAAGIAFRSGPDVRVLPGPGTAAQPWRPLDALTHREFAAANEAAASRVVASPPAAWIKTLPSDPAAAWINVTGRGDVPAGQHEPSGLYAVTIDNPRGRVSDATLTLRFAADNQLGRKDSGAWATFPVYLNGVALSPDPSSDASTGVQRFAKEYTLRFSGLTLEAGENWLYLHAVNAVDGGAAGGPGGVIFSGVFTPPPAETPLTPPDTPDDTPGPPDETDPPMPVVTDPPTPLTPLTPPEGESPDPESRIQDAVYYGAYAAGLRETLVGDAARTDGRSKLFDRRSFADKTATRNKGLVLASVDLSPLAAGTSYYPNTMGGGCLIARDCLAAAAHFNAMFQPGRTVMFVSPANAVYLRKIAAAQAVAGTDIWLARLESDVPDDIAHAAVLPKQYAETLPAKRLSVWYTDQRYTLYSGVATLSTQYAVTDRRLSADSGKPLYRTADGGTTDISIGTNLTGPVSDPWFKVMISGDSGSPTFTLAPRPGGGHRVVFLGAHTYGTPSGPFITAYYDDVNDAMKALGSQRQLTDADLSSFSKP